MTVLKTWSEPKPTRARTQLVSFVPRLTISIHWYMETAHLDDPKPPLWRVHVAGQPGLRIAVDLEKRAGDTTPTSAEQIALAGSVINAIPVVCAAPPGVMTRPLATPFNAALARGEVAVPGTRSG